MTEPNELREALKRFYLYLEHILITYQNLIPTLKQEIRAIEEDNLTDLNDILKPQQALLLDTKSFSNNLGQHFSTMGIKAENLTEFIRLLPEDEQLPFYSLLGQFQQTAEEVRFYKEKCHTLLQAKLYRIDSVLSRQEGFNHATYNQKAAEVRGTGFVKSFETKI